MTVKQMRAEILSARKTINTNFDKINNAIKNRKLPQATKSTYFYQTVESLKQSGKKNILNQPISKLRKSDLAKILKGVEKIRDTPSGTVAGARNRLEESKNTARSVLVANGFSGNDVENMNARQLSNVFRFADLLKELYGYGDSDAIREARQIQEESGKTMYQLWKHYKDKPPTESSDWESAFEK